MILKHSNHGSFMILIESQNKKMAAMTADTDAVGDILFECGICHVTFKNIDEFNSQEHDCFKHFTKPFHALIISSTLEEVKGSMYEAVCRK